MQYFASFQPFEIFEEFNGVSGTYIKSFLISDKINLNDWQATHEANISNLDSFLGRPGIHYINAEGKLDHTSATSFEKSLQQLKVSLEKLPKKQRIKIIKKGKK